MVKQCVINMENTISKKIIEKIRECAYQNELKHSLPNINESEEKSMDDDNKKEFIITKTTPQFGDVYTSQIEAIKKCIGEGISFGEKALVYYPDNNDLTINGKIQAVNVVFQFRYADPSGDGLYVWANGTQLTDANLRIFGKIRDAFNNWKTTLVQSDDLLEKLKKVSEK